MAESSLSRRQGGEAPRRSALEIARRNRSEPGRALSAVMKTAVTARELADTPAAKQARR